MAIKKEIRSKIRNLCPKIDTENRYHPLVIDSVCESVLNQLITNLFVKGGSMEPYMKRYGDATALTVLTDAITGVDYTTLPVSYIPLPDKRSGVRNIFTVQMGGITFYPMTSTELDLSIRNTYFSLLTNKIAYVVYPDKIEYYGMTDGIRSAGVRMDIVIPFREYADDDVVNIPGITSDEFVKLVLEKMGVIQPVELTDDNASPRGGTK